MRLAVERIQPLEMLEQHRADPPRRRRRKALAGREEVRDLTEDPRPPLGATADHQRIGRGLGQHPSCLLGRADVAVGDDRNPHRLLDRGDRFVLGHALEAILAAPAMHGQGGDARVLGDARDAHAIAFGPRPTRADLERHRHGHRGRDGRADAADQRLVAQQRRTGVDLADLLGRAAHVDVDDLRAVIDVVACRLGQQQRIMAGDLHGHRPGLAAMLHARARLLGLPHARVDARHLGHGEPGAHAPTEHAEGAIGHAGHRGQHERRSNQMRADLHPRIFADRRLHRRRSAHRHPMMPSPARSPRR